MPHQYFKQQQHLSQDYQRIAASVFEEYCWSYNTFAKIRAYKNFGLHWQNDPYIGV
jgi:hypothetical protein